MLISLENADRYSVLADNQFFSLFLDTKKVAIFCDSEFWHGYDWEHKNKEIKTRREFWIPKIERNIERDREVTKTLEDEGWTVVRFWGKQIKKDPTGCADVIEDILRRK